MPYPNFHAFRLISPERFEEKSFKTKEITSGIEIIIGTLKGKDTTTTQAYRFDKTKYSYPQAKKWLDDHNIKYLLSEPARKTEESTKMDRYKRNAIAAQYIQRIMEQDSSNKSWADVNKNQLPKECFLWVEDPNRKSTWHLPYREGDGGIDSKTGMYRSTGPVNLNALRAIASAIGGSRTGTPINVPSEIKGKINKLMKEYKIGEYSESRKEDNTNRNIFESCSVEISEQTYDREQGVIKGLAILRPTSKNCNFKEGLGRKYADKALQNVSEMISGRKAFLNHQGKTESSDNYGVRKIDDLIGVYENGRIENGIPRADMRILQTQKVKELIEAVIKLGAAGVGISIVGSGKSSFDKNSKTEIIESITSLSSADWVSETGSTINLFESDQNADENIETEIKEENNMDYSQLTLVDLKHERPDLFESIREGVEKDLESDRKENEKAKVILTENEKLKKENSDLKKENDEYKVKEAIAKRKEEVTKEIIESKIESQYVTETFRESLERENSADTRKAMIDDRKKLITESKSTNVRGVGKEKVIPETNKSTDEETYKEVCESIGFDRKGN